MRKNISNMKNKGHPNIYILWRSSRRAGSSHYREWVAAKLSSI